MVRPLNYDAGLNLREAKGRLQEVIDDFEKVKKNYSGWFSKYKRKMDEKDQETLINCIQLVLLPLDSAKAVREQLSKIRNLEDTIGYQAIMLRDEIRNYIGGFKNTDMMRAESGKFIG